MYTLLYVYVHVYVHVYTHIHAHVICVYAHAHGICVYAHMHTEYAIMKKNNKEVVLVLVKFNEQIGKLILYQEEL